MFAESNLSAAVLFGGVLLLSACANCPPEKKLEARPAAPKAGDIVLSRDALYPARVRYVHLPYIDAGAVLQIDADQHVLTRNYPFDRNYDHTWQQDERRGIHRVGQPPYVVPSQNKRERDPRPAAPPPPTKKPAEQEVRTDEPALTETSRPMQPPPPAGRAFPASTQSPPPPSAPVANARPAPEHFCDDGEAPEDTGCIYPK